MSLRALHIFFILTALAFLSFLFYWAGRRYVQYGLMEALPLALAALGGLAAGIPYLYWFVKKDKNGK